MTRCASSHISASPSRTVSTSSTGCEWVGAPVPGAIHCSKMHNCAAPLLAEATMRVSTPGRHCSSGVSWGSLTFMKFAPLFRGDRPVSKADASFPYQDQALPIDVINHPTMDHSMTPAPQKVALVTGAARGIGL